MPGCTLGKHGSVGGAQGSGLGTCWVVMPFAKPDLILGPEIPADNTSLVVFQVNEIYHDESLGAHINVVLVRIILLSYGKVSECPPLWGAPAPTTRHRPPLKVFISPKPPASSRRLPCASCQKQETCQSPLLSGSPFTHALVLNCRFCYYSGVVRIAHQEVTAVEKTACSPQTLPHRVSGKHQGQSEGRRREG